MRVGNYNIESDGDYYTISEIKISEKGKNKGKDYLTNHKYFHGLEKAINYLSRLEASKMLRAARVLGDLEKALQEPLRRLYGDIQSKEETIRDFMASLEVENGLFTIDTSQPMNFYDVEDYAEIYIKSLKEVWDDEDKITK